MIIKTIFSGFPGKIKDNGYLGWSAIVYLETANRKILFDTGGANRRGVILNKLKEYGIDPNHIDTLVLSHFHEDHVYNFDYFCNAEILLHKVEADWVESNPDEFAIPQFLYPEIKRTKRLRLIETDQEIAPGVSTLLVPGHTPGCMALVLQEADMPTTVLAGDAVKNMAELSTGTVAQSLDDRKSMESIAKIRNIADIVIPGHDRKLQVQSDQIVALSEAKETIVVPQNVIDENGPTYFDLTISKNSLPIR